jgi:alpha-2-macroglobulin
MWLITGPARANQHLLTAACAAFLALSACGEPPDGATGKSKGTTTAKQRPPEPKLSPAALAPVIRPLAPRDALPERLQIQLARAVIDDGPRPVKKDTRLTIEPHIPGALRFASGSSLEWVPKPGHAFAPETRYSITLHSVESTTGVRRPPAGRAWRHSFTTPAFRLLRLFGAAQAGGGGRAELDVLFSAPVDPAALRRRARWSVDNKRIAGAIYKRGDDPYTVRVRLRHPALTRDKRAVTLTLAAGVPLHRATQRPGVAQAAIRAPAAEVTVLVRRRPPAKILRAELKEGRSGHYIDVDCDDRAVRAERQYYWDYRRRRSDKISARCVLRDEALTLGRISFSPPLGFSVSARRHGFRVLGQFSRGAYLMRIEAGAQTRDGAVVTRTFTKRFVVQSRRSTLSFVTRGRYLPRGTDPALALRHLNADRVDLTVRHVPPRNLVFWLTGREPAGERTSDLLRHTTLQLKRTPIDRQGLTWFSLSRLLGAEAGKRKRPPGLYEIKVSAGAREDALRLLATEINLVVKRAEAPAAPAKDEDEATGDSSPAPPSPELKVWALSTSTNKALPGVQVRLIRRSGRVLGRCTTGKGGGCSITSLRPDAAKDVDPARPFALLASRGDDVTYLTFAELATHRLDGHRPSYLAHKAGYRASLYGDRGVYRPGETVHLAAILRDAEHRAPPARLPLELVVHDPRGRVLTRRLLRTNTAGMMATDLSLPDFALTGSYEARLLVAGKRAASLGFSVETYVPERMRASVRSLSKQWSADDAAALQVRARYLFGGSADGSAVELTCRLEPAEFTPPGYKGYHFGSAAVTRRHYRPLELGAVKGTLGLKGQATLRCPRLSAAGGLLGPSRLLARAAVFEAGSGRTTVASTSVPVHPERYYLGLRAAAATKPEGPQARKGRPLRLQGVVTGWDGKLDHSVREVQVELSRIIEEYGWYRDPHGGYDGYQRYKRLIQEAPPRRVAVKGGRFSFSVKPQAESHGYLVTALAGRTRTDLQLTGARLDEDEVTRGWDDPDAERTPRPDAPDQVELFAPDKPLEVGRRATVRFKVPHAGRVLLSLETHRVLSARWREVKAGEHRFSFTLDGFVPNVHVSALLVRRPGDPDRGRFAPGRAFGTLSIPVRPRQHEQRIKIIAPDEVRPRGKLTLRLNLGRGGAGERFVTVAAVDEGILSLTGHKSPDPLADLFTPRALGVETFDTAGWGLQLAARRGAQRPAGGGAALRDPGGPSSRVIKSVALWSGLLPVPASGKLQVAFEVPLFRGALRVMAVAAGKRTAGAAATRVLVRDPLVLQTTPPRRLVQGDEAQVPVFVTNLSGRARTVEVTASAAAAQGEGNPISFEQGTRRTLRLKDRQSGTAVFVVRAGQRPGVARLHIAARAAGVTSFDTQLLPVVPSGPETRRSIRLRLRPGRNDLRPLLTGWAPWSERSTFRVSAVPFGDAFHHLDHLLGYPYGCVEQTVSSTRPLLAIPQLVRQAAPVLLARRGGVERMVTHGIRRLLAMQTHSGGFGYWPGASSADAWGSVYATHLLLDARQQGYPVPPGRVAAALTYLENRAGGSGQRGSDHAEPYAHYVLARAGRGKRGRIQELIDALPRGPRGEQAEQAYLLKAALYLAGDRRYAGQLRRGLNLLPPRKRRGAPSYYSALRGRALVASVFVDLFGAHAAAAPAMRKLAAALRADARSRSHTTQELAWSIDALGKWVRKKSRAQGLERASLLVEGVTARPVEKGAPGWSLRRASERRQLVLELPTGGPLRAGARSKEPRGSAYLFISSRGVRLGARHRYGGSGLRLKREHLDAQGKPLAPGTHRLGQLVLTRITLTNTTGRHVDNIALVDRFPAGWEVENPRLGRGQLPAWARKGKPWNVAHLNLRDDRVELFGALAPRQAVTVVHVARATVAGRFSAPPVFAEAMYAPEVWARAPGGVVVIEGPWARYLN